MPLQQVFAFNAGEWSPRLAARSDLEKYQAACQHLENFVPLPYGGAQNRQGFQYIGTAKSGATRKCRVIRFSYSASTNFVIELGHLYARFYSNGAQVESSPGTPEEVVTPFEEDELFDVQFLQIRDVVYFTHPAHTPQKLTRVADDNWTWAAVAYTIWPFKDENVTTTTIASSSAAVGTGRTLTASTGIFNANHVGSRWQISHRRGDATVEDAFDANGNSSSILARGNWTVRTTGTWAATLEVQQSLDDGSTWETLRTFKSNSDRNFEITSLVEQTCLMRLVISNRSVGSATTRAILEIEDAFVHGVALITGYTNSTTVTATIETALHSTAATTYWSEAAWSDDEGWPRAIALHENRVWYGGTAGQSLTVWGSVIADFDNFILGANDDDAVQFTLSSATANQIQWLLSYQRSLVIGTAGEEFLLQSRSEDVGITATNVSAAPQSRFGSSSLGAILMNDSLIFAQRAGGTLRDFTYQFDRDAWSGIDVSILAEHLIREGVEQMAFQQQPYATLWCVVNGRLAALTYERDQGVIAWHRHTTQGTFESVAVIPGADEDEVWVSVKRTIDGNTVRYIERLEPGTLTSADVNDVSECLYLDAGKKITQASSTSVTGLSHLEGMTVGLLVDGATHPPKTVASGAITLEWAGEQISVGLPYESILEPMALVSPMGGGSSFGQISRVDQAMVRLHQTSGLQFTVHGSDADDDQWDEIPFRTTSDNMDAPPPLFTGTKKLPIPGRHAREISLALRQTLPLPSTVLSLMIEWSKTEKV